MPIIEGTSDATLRQETNPCSALAMDAVTFNATTVIEYCWLGKYVNRDTLIRFAVKIIDTKIISKSYHYAPTSVWVNAFTAPLFRPPDIRSLH